MTLTFALCEGQIRHTLGSTPSSEVSVNMLVNQAGGYLAGCHPWKWLVRPPIDLDLRGAISFTGATWVNGTLTLTATGAFTNYTWKAGDQLVVTAGTNTTTGTYNVASKVSANAITLTASVGATASAISGTLSFPWIVLPADFSECLRLEGGTTATDIRLTTYLDIMQRRSVGLSGEAHTYRAALMWRQAFTDLVPAESSPVPRLELDRIPQANSVAAFTMTYRAGFPRQADDSALAQIPPWIELLFVQMLRAIARGYEEEDEGGMDERLVPIFTGPIMLAAKRQDAMIQRSYGTLGPGEMSRPEEYSEEGDGWIASPVSAPSTL